LKIFTFLLLFAISVFFFIAYQKAPDKKENSNDLLVHVPVEKNTDNISQSEKTAGLINSPSTVIFKNKKTFVDSLIAFAESLIGVPYRYASTDPSVGFDCSGFITYVFNHFKISVPRSSKDFRDEGVTIPLQKSKPGDLILFTGTDSTERVIGHMGIIVSNDNNGITFIHSTSGKAYGVVNTQLNNYYRGRFVKVVRIGLPGLP